MPQALNAWTPTDGVAPELGIGIVLPEDGRTSITISDPRDDLKVEGLRAGRGFHWEKMISQRLPGVLEVRPAGDRLMVVCRLPAEEYLVGVITSEMRGECPPDFLKAQCVVARSWTLANTEKKHADLGIDYCNDDCCQRFQGLEGATEAARRAVDETMGEVLMTAAGEVVDANYSKSCGGIAEDPMHVWPGKPKPGLSPLVDAPPSSPIHRMYPLHEPRLLEYLTGDWLRACDAYCSDRAVSPEAIGRYLGRVDTPQGFFRWRVSYTREELESLLNRKQGVAPGMAGEGGVATLKDIQVTRRGVSGRATAIQLKYIANDGESVTTQICDQYRIRQTLHESFLYSSAFLIDQERDRDGTLVRINLLGAGWGHGAGFCQIGGLGMALAGFDYRQILQHYFPSAQLVCVYER